MKTISGIQKKRYLVMQGGECPSCYSSEVTGGSFSGDGEQLWQDMECQSCDFRWTDIYELVDIVGENDARGGRA